MAQLTDTNINGNLRVTGKMYGGNIIAESVADYVDGTSPIKIGWTGSALSSTTYLGAYSTSGSRTLLRAMNVDDVSVGYAGSYGTLTSHPQIGASNKPLYVNSSGNFTPLTASAGGNNRLLYMSSGQLLSASGSAGDSTHPVYMRNGTFTQCSASASTAIGYTVEYNMLQSPAFTLTTSLTTIFTFEHITGFDRLVYFTVSNTKNAGNSTLVTSFYNPTAGTYKAGSYYGNVPSYGTTSFCVVIPEEFHQAGSSWGPVQMKLSTNAGSPQMYVSVYGTSILLKNPPLEY